MTIAPDVLAHLNGGLPLVPPILLKEWKGDPQVYAGDFMQWLDCEWVRLFFGSWPGTNTVSTFAPGHPLTVEDLHDTIRELEKSRPSPPPGAFNQPLQDGFQLFQEGIKPLPFRPFPPAMFTGKTGHEDDK